MRLRPPIEIKDRSDLKPKNGDAVMFEGVEHIVTSVGLRYVHMYRADDAKKFTRMAKMQHISKKISSTGDVL